MDPIAPTSRFTPLGSATPILLPLKGGAKKCCGQGHLLRRHKMPGELVVGDLGQILVQLPDHHFGRRLG